MTQDITTAIAKRLERLNAIVQNERYKLSYAVAKEWAIESIQRRLDALQEAENAHALMGDAFDGIETGWPGDLKNEIETLSAHMQLLSAEQLKKPTGKAFRRTYKFLTSLTETPQRRTP